MCLCHIYRSSTDCNYLDECLLLYEQFTLFCSSLIFAVAITKPIPSHLILTFGLFGLSDFDSLDERDHEKNNQLGFDVAEREFGISPCMTGKEMSSVVEPDKLSMVMYLSQFYEMFKDTVPPGGESG